MLTTFILVRGLAINPIVEVLCRPEKETEIGKPLLHGCVCFHVTAVLYWWYLIENVAR